MKGRLYVLADWLTMVRLLFAALVVQYTIYDLEVGFFLFTFGIGMATDALDGIFARKDPRPTEANDYFWAIADQIADMLLLASGAFYFVIRFMPHKLGISMIWGLAAIAIVVITAGYIQIFRNKNTVDGEDHKKETDPKLMRIIFWRRIGFVAAIVFLIDIVLFFGVDFLVDMPMFPKLVLVAVTIVLTIIGAYLKRDRLKEDKTPIIRDGRECYPSKRKWLRTGSENVRKTRMFFGITILVMAVLAFTPFISASKVFMIICWAVAIILWILLSRNVIRHVA